MWLLNTSTITLHNIITQNVIKYAILSHTWGDEEASFQDMMMQGNSEAKSPADYVYAWCGQLVPWSSRKTYMKQQKGYKKIERCCAEALADGYDWIWVDTVCIDKKSSAELSEAINSMYDWYGKSTVCYAYMSDVSMTTEDLDATVIDEFKSSRWFRRGWTLQELLAPSDILFYDKNWRYLGNKFQLADHITSATGIHQKYLWSRVQCANASIATRMSWASNRSTTRLEDEAYCLLGLSQINMALLDGEGSRAFIRLQHEIIRNSDDESIFAWYKEEFQSGPFAKRPSAFAGCGHYFPYDEPIFAEKPNTITNRGLSLEADYRATLHDCNARLARQQLKSCILLPLNCTSVHLQGRPFTIILERISRDTYVRYLAGEIVNFDKYWNHVVSNVLTMIPIYIKEPVNDDQRYGRLYTDYSRFGKQFGGKLYNGLVTIDRYSVGCNATDEWFITSPGHIISPNLRQADDWKLRLCGWSGFAVLTTKDMDGNPLRITITYGHTATYDTAFSLRLSRTSKNVAKVVKACFDQHEERKSHLEVRSEYILQLGESKVLALEQRMADEMMADDENSYTLAIRSV